MNSFSRRWCQLMSAPAFPSGECPGLALLSLKEAIVTYLTKSLPTSCSSRSTLPRVPLSSISNVLIAAPLASVFGMFLIFGRSSRRRQLRAIQRDRAEKSSSGPEVYLLRALQETLESEERFEESQIVRGLLPEYLPDIDWQDVTSEQVRQALRQFGDYSLPSARGQSDEVPLNRRLFKSEGDSQNAAPAPAPGLTLPSARRAPARIVGGQRRTSTRVHSPLLASPRQWIPLQIKLTRRLRRALIIPPLRVVRLLCLSLLPCRPPSVFSARSAGGRKALKIPLWTRLWSLAR